MSRRYGVISYGAALTLGILMVYPTIELHAPPGLVELSNNPGKALLMNCAYPAIHHASIYLLYIHPYIHVNMHLLTYEDEHADQ